MATLVVAALLYDDIKESKPHIAGLAIFACAVLGAAAAKGAKAVFKTFLRPGKDLKKLGEWAVVTGATDGIGKAYALALAQKGLNIVLISRTESKLQEVEKEIKSASPGVSVKYVVCDYSKFDEKAKATVMTALKGLDVGILVNNVGVSYPYPKFFHELTDENVTQLLEMNVNSTTYMTRMVLGGMVERKRGSIVNISSGSAMYSLPLLAEYSAAKSYIEKFSRALNAEYSAIGVTCQCQIPFYVATKLAKMRKSLTVPTPTEYVKCALRWVGQPEAVVSPFWLHGFQGWAMDLVPESLVTMGIMNMHMAIRKKGMKKDARLADESKKAK